MKKSVKPAGISVQHKFKEKTQEKLMLFPFLLFFGIFTILPVLSSLVLSFTDFNMLQLPKFSGLNNYFTLLLNDDVF